MFKSARVNLTLYYLAIIVFVTLISTLGTRYLAENAFDTSYNISRSGIKTLLRQEVGLPLPDSGIRSVQDRAENQVVTSLNEYVIYINLLALVIGGITSYWFAGRTLKPIEEAHMAQSRFASDASHELRTPLTVMRTENEVFLRQSDFTKDEAKEQITSNLEEIERLEQLSTNLLALAKYEQGDHLDISTLKTQEIAERSIENLKKLHPHDYDKVSVHVDSAKVEGHLDSLVQVLVIFLDNAIKYSPAEKHIKLVGKKHEDLYRFMVEDNGQGIATEDMPLIFDRLFRSDKTRTKTVQGYGLGLSLAKEIAKANDAGLSVANIKGSGARFTLTVRLSS